MGLALVLLVLLVSPFVVSAAVNAARRHWERADKHRPVADALPIERVAADLRRLRAQLEARENRPGLSGKGMRMGAVRLAYVEVLEVACRQLDVQPPRSGPEWQTSLAEIYRVEAQLRERGLDVCPVRYQGFRAA